VEIHSREALFLIDGAVLGKRNFAFAGNDGILYFGTSPLISVNVPLCQIKPVKRLCFRIKNSTLAMVYRGQECRKQ
jgi:hypothetical protein